MTIMSPVISTTSAEWVATARVVTPGLGLKACNVVFKGTGVPSRGVASGSALPVGATDM